MSTRTLIRLVLAAVFLVLAWIGIGLFLGQDPEAPVASEGWSQVLAVLETGGEAAESVRMEDADGPRVLERGPDGSWMVNGFLADSAVVDRFWTTAGGVELGGVVASNPSNHERMGVAGDSAITVSMATTTGDAEFVVGARGPGVGTNYVRLPTEDDVRTLAGGLAAFVERSEWQWRDKRMTVVDTAAVATIDVDTPDYDYALLRLDTVWTLGGDTVQTPTVTGLLEELANMVAAGALEPDDPLSLAPVTITVTALGAEGDTLGVAMIGDGAGDRAGRTPGRETIYLIPNFRIERLTPPPTLLIPQ
jgi:hypothetical protein